jgi:hypothetical protein
MMKRKDWKRGIHTYNKDKRTAFCGVKKENKGTQAVKICK